MLENNYSSIPAIHSSTANAINLLLQHKMSDDDDGVNPPQLGQFHKASFQLTKILATFTDPSSRENYNVAAGFYKFDHIFNS